MAAELKQRDISWNNKLREHVTSEGGYDAIGAEHEGAKKTGVVLEKCWEPPRSARPRGSGSPFLPS